MPEAKIRSDEVYLADAPFPTDIDHVLVTYCSDPWYGEGTLEFLTHHLDLTHRDQIVVPGGPAAFLQSSMTFTADRGRLNLLIEHHEVSRVLAVAHLNCAYYKLRHPNLDDAARRQRQEQDLVTFLEWMQKNYPKVAVELYYAEKQHDNLRILQIRDASR